MENGEQMTTILIMGSSSPETSAGLQLLRAARAKGIDASYFPSNSAYTQGFTRKIAFKFMGDYPLLGKRFQSDFLRRRRGQILDFLITTGKAPLFSETLERVRALGIKTINFSTDEVWNPLYSSGWFHRSLASYDVIATPRTQNIATCRDLPGATGHVHFGYSPDLHYWEDQPEDSSDGEIFFAGGCDEDRAPFFEALAEAGLRSCLYGGYWDKHERLAPFHRGMASLATMRKQHARIPVSVCLVRRANRDEHVMRTFEAPAMGACLAMEDTSEHRAIRGTRPCRPLLLRARELGQCVQGASESPELRRKLRKRLRYRYTR